MENSYEWKHITLRISEYDELQTVSKAWMIGGGIAVVLGGSVGALVLWDLLTPSIEYTATITQSNIQYIDARGVPVKFNCSFASPGRQQFNHVMSHDQNHSVGDVVQFKERNGVRRVGGKQQNVHALIVCSVVVLIGTGFFYLGSTANLPRWTYWPPNITQWYVDSIVAE